MSRASNMRRVAYKHGHASVGGVTGRRSPENEAWRSMKKRCLNPKNENYPRYGGRGITVCPRWIDSFVAFFEDVGPRPSPAHSLDREDVNGNYEPGNVHWVLPDAQHNNKQASRKITFKGRTQTFAQWARETGLDSSVVRQRFRAGWAIADVLSPVRRRPWDVARGAAK